MRKELLQKIARKESVFRGLVDEQVGREAPEEIIVDRDCIELKSMQSIQFAWLDFHLDNTL